MFRLYFPVKSVILATFVATLVACGGSPNETASLSLHGVAATGLALENATVSVICNAATGTGTVTTTSTTNATGNYTVTAANGKPPCLVTATKTTGGVTVTLNSIALTEGVANITPITNMLVAGLRSAKGAATVADLIKPAYSPGPTDLANAQVVVLNAINGALVAQGRPSLPTGTNLMTDPNFVASTPSTPSSNLVDVAMDNLTEIGAVTSSGQASTTLQDGINTAAHDVIPVNPPGATGGT
jgi:hypothetical protein